VGLDNLRRLVDWPASARGFPRIDFLLEPPDTLGRQLQLLRKIARRE
jgi:hypothetical protein